MRSPHQSLWWATLPTQRGDRDSLRGDLDVDVAIVGGGYTGLWTALHLLERDRRLRVAVVEAEVAGFGASGRNGGWASALYPKTFEQLASTHGEDGARHLRSTLRTAVRELGERAALEGIVCDYQRGGTIALARSELQADRLRAALDAARRWGDTDDDVRWLDADEAAARCSVTDLLGGLYTPHCASLHPAKLARGLADAVERRGATIYERTRATRLEPATPSTRARCVTAAGVVHADVVVRATEGFTPTLRQAHREVVPLYSLMVATEPLSSSFFDRVGLAERETFTDARHLIIYGQRTADDRLAFGGRGAPYHFASRVRTRFDRAPRVFAKLEATLVELFGELDGAVTHRWGGPLGMARDLSPFVRLDRTAGLAAVGGYVGDGVVMSFVAGRALAALICGDDAEVAELPFVGHRARPWEVEPLRWLGINGALRAADVADSREASNGTPSRAASVLERLQGS